MIINWLHSEELVEYSAAVAFMEEKIPQIAAGTYPETIWLLQHPSLYTAGTSAKAGDLLTPDFPVYHSGRGGQYTYHGPGQLVAYVMINLKKHGLYPNSYVHLLEDWVIRTLALHGIKGEKRCDRIGVWVADSRHPQQENKIAAIGIRVRKGITYHGVAVNICPNLQHFTGIIPCGIREFGVTSLEKLGVNCTVQQFSKLMQEQWLDL
ncbi:MAG: lipoyl(octanoyl) transferase LipB [Alphaproteobacteria bacterium]